MSTTEMPTGAPDFDLERGAMRHLADRPPAERREHERREHERREQDRQRAQQRPRSAEGHGERKPDARVHARPETRVATPRVKHDSPAAKSAKPTNGTASSPQSGSPPSHKPGLKSAATSGLKRSAARKSA